MSEWKDYKLGDLGTVITGKTPSKNNPEDWGDEMPFVTPTDYKNYGKFAKKAERNLSKIGIERLKGKILPSKSILVTCIGSDMGKVVINIRQVITNQQINSLIPNSKADSDFLYYRLVSMYETLRIYGGDGTAVPIVNKGDFENIETEIPPLPEQTAIASVLSSLDNKIDLLHRQNATLEKMAETLFRQWFVEESKEEWEEVELGRLIEINGGFSYKGEYIGTGEGLLLGMGCVSFQDRFLPSGARPYSGDCPEKYLVNPTDLVIATRQQSDNQPILGFPAIVPPEFKGKRVIVGANLYRVKNNTQIDNYFFYLILRSAEYRQHILASSKGSTVRMITKDAIEKYKIAIPSSEVIESLMELLKPINEKSTTNQTQIRTLTVLRDTLLPKLMSGEIRIS